MKPERLLAPEVDARLSPPEREALWVGIEATLDEHAAKRAKLRSVAAVASLAACGVLIFALGRIKPAPTAAAAGPLHLQDGASLPSAELVRGAAAAVVFEDRSVFRPEPGARVEILDNSAQRFALKQSAGKALYLVTPDGPRRWTVDTPLGTVEVVGTEFSVDASANHVRVEVNHGVVIVRGDWVPEHAARLEAGDHLDIERPKAETAPTVGAPGVSGLRPAPAVDSGPARVSELLMLADDLRRTGRAVEAVAPLEQIISKHVQDPRAALAAFTLGRIQMDVLDQPKEAERTFEKALSMQLDAALQEDATWRRARLLNELGRTEEAAALARSFVQKHPGTAVRFEPLMGRR